MQFTSTSRTATAAVVLVAAFALLPACGGEFGLPAYQGEGLPYPVSMTPDPGGRWLYVVGANFDRQYRGGVVSVLDTHTNTFVKTGRAEVPTHAAGLALHARPDGSERLYVASRDDDSISLIDVVTDGTEAPRLDCGQGAGALKPCADSHRFGGDQTGDLDIGLDPIELVVDPAPSGDETLVTVVATSDGQVTVISPYGKSDDDASGARVLDQIHLGSGLSAVATSPLTGRTYVADARLNRLYNHSLLPVLDEKTGGRTGWAIDRKATIVLPRASSGEYARGMALSLDHSRLYIAYRSPNALLIVDIAPSETGAPANALVDTIGLGGRPAQVAVAPTGPQGKERVYVSCFGSDDIWVVDPGLRAVVDVIALKHSPYGIAAMKVTDSANPQGLWRLYAGLFSRHEVVAIDIDPQAASPHAVLATIR